MERVDRRDDPGRRLARGSSRRASIALAGLIALAAALAAVAPAGAVRPYPAAKHLSKGIGPRPAAGKAEARAHAYVAKRFRAAGLRVKLNGFRVPGRGRSRNVVGIHDTPRSCLKILMAHADSVIGVQGANDNASGVGVLVALAPRLERLDPRCDLWLVATGSEEREVTGTPDHLGATALVRRVERHRRVGQLRYALSLDMVGRGNRFWLRSPRKRLRRGVERQVQRQAKRAGVRVRWVRDSGEGNSDHREFELAGMRAAVLEAWRGSDPCHHADCDRWRRLQRGALRRALRLAGALARAG